ncbi:MAG: DNA-processing protein DprA [Cumulibacter sp.]
MSGYVGDGSERAALAWLSRACEPGEYALWAYVESQGAVEVAAQLAAGRAPGRLQRLCGARAGEDRCQRDLDAARRVGARLIIPGDDEWPTDGVRLMSIASAAGADGCVPPLSIWARGGGRLAALVDRSVALVGARAATAYGTSVCEQIAYGLAHRDVTVISGGAFGIDRAAHAAALAANGVTIAALACGIDRFYPKSNAGLLERITADGLLLSEWAPGAAPMRHRFLVRNRLIAALSSGTVVVEAALRSGARSTAARARDLGKVVMTVPGPVTSAMSDGCLHMLREEAALAVGCAEHVLEATSLSGTDLLPLERGPGRPGDDLDPMHRRVLEAVPTRRAATTESIAVVAGASVPDTLRALTMLELSQFVEQYEGRWRTYRKATSR